MNIGIQLFRAQNRVLSLVYPQKAVDKAGKVFFTPRRHQTKSWEEHAESTGTRITLANGISAIRWGSGMPVLLMHGWESRATQMAGFIEPLIAQGFEVIAIDAPAHGRSKGQHAHPGKFVEAMFLAEQKLGPFYAVIGHSMGAGSAIYAASQGLQAEKLVAISGPANFQTVSRRFANFMGLNSPAINRFLVHVEETVGITFDEINVVKRAPSVKQPLLIIHDRDDGEIPIGDAHQLHNAFEQAHYYETQGLGHRKIMCDPMVIDTATRFVTCDQDNFVKETL